MGKKLLKTLHKKANANGQQIYEKMMTFYLQLGNLKETVKYHFTPLRWTIVKR